MHGQFARFPRLTMEYNSKKLERISRFVYYFISLVLCFF